MPTNPVVPITPTNPATGTTPSGTNPTSGIEGTFPGPFYIQQQTLDVEYVRAPFQCYPDGAIKWSLSGNMATAENGCTLSSLHMINWTQLYCIIKATYTVEKSDDSYATSAWTEGQRFKVDAFEKDAYGNSYGSLSGLSALGPMGSIFTEVPWYRRRAWDATNDEEVSKSITATTAFKVAYPNGWDACLPGKGECPNIEAFEISIGDFTNFNNTMQMPHKAMSPIRSDEPWVNGYPLYVLPGNYSLDKESKINMKKITSEIGGLLRYLQLYKLKATIGTDAANQDEYNSPVQDHGLVEYRFQRHDWS